MGLFNRKKDDYSQASKRMNESSSLRASDRIIFEHLDDNDEKAAQLINELKDGHPLVIDFSNLDPRGINKMLAFFSGAAFALDGEIIFVKEKRYMFVRKIDLLDGSIKEQLERIKG
ncbi:MAG: cell division protein SepF [Anaeroplasmataceae bacterium]